MIYVGMDVTLNNEKTGGSTVLKVTTRWCHIMVMVKWTCGFEKRISPWLKCTLFNYGYNHTWEPKDQGIRLKNEDWMMNSSLMQSLCLPACSRQVGKLGWNCI